MHKDVKRVFVIQWLLYFTAVTLACIAPKTWGVIMTIIAIAFYGEIYALYKVLLTRGHMLEYHELPEGDYQIVFVHDYHCHLIIGIKPIAIPCDIRIVRCSFGALTIKEKDGGILKIRKTSPSTEVKICKNSFD